MSLHILSPVEQYMVGDDIWVFSDLKHSTTLKKIDWYLNFQFFNCNFKNESKKIYIPCQDKLSAKAILSIPYQNNLEPWAQEIKNFWEKLNKPKIRIFLPDSVKVITLFQLDIADSVNVVPG